MRKSLVALLCGVALALASAASALGASNSASCVGQFSEFFVQGGLDTHRSEVARFFADNARPAGANVYSRVTQLHGDFDSCFALANAEI